MMADVGILSEEDLFYYIADVLRFMGKGTNILKLAIQEVDKEWQQKVAAEKMIEEEAWEWDYPTVEGPMATLPEPEPIPGPVNPKTDPPYYDEHGILRNDLNVNPPYLDGTGIPWIMPLWYYRRRNPEISRRGNQARTLITEMDYFHQDPAATIAASLRRSIGYSPNDKRVKVKGHTVSIEWWEDHRTWHYGILRRRLLDTVRPGIYIMLQVSYVAKQPIRNRRFLGTEGDMTQQELNLKNGEDE